MDYVLVNIRAHKRKVETEAKETIWKDTRHQAVIYKIWWEEWRMEEESGNRRK